MKGYVLRYRPGTPYGDQFPKWRPWHTTLPTPEAAEQLRQACASTDQLEVITTDQEGAA